MPPGVAGAAPCLTPRAQRNLVAALNFFRGMETGAALEHGVETWAARGHNGLIRGGGPATNLGAISPLTSS